MQAFNAIKLKTVQNSTKHLVLTTPELVSKLKTSSFFKSLSTGIHAQLDKCLKDYKIAEEAPYKGFSIHFENGAEVCVLPIPKEITVYDLHCTLSTCVGGYFSTNSDDTQTCDLSDLKKNIQSECVQAISSLAVLNKWKFPKKSKKVNEEKQKNHKTEIGFLTGLTPSELEADFQLGVHLAEANNLVRTLAETPANFLKPDAYRDLIKSRAKEHKYGFEFIGMDQLRKMEAGAFVAVAKGDPDDLGGIVHLTYRPKKSSKKKIALVGKGICFDTGGYNVKTGNYMHGMHRDMTGSAVTLALFECLVHQEVPFEVHAYLAIAENLISPHANRPNDLIFASNGLSIEMIDTDAEGRLVLADTLVMASKIKPDLILDFATLTGSAVRALDTRIAAVFSNSDTWLKKAYEAGQTSGERTWGFPCGGDYMKKLKSDVADVKQCNTAPNADHIYAATFLSLFVEKGVNWVHMDLCTDTNGGGLGLVKTECTGFGVRWGWKMLEGIK